MQAMYSSWGREGGQNKSSLSSFTRRTTTTLAFVHLALCMCLTRPLSALARRPLAADRCNQTNQAVADLCAEVASQPNAQLFVSLLEIYNERATDLLAEPCGGNGGDGGGDSSRRRRPPLRVRECPERGPYIAELSERLVMATAEGGDMAGASQGARRAMSALAEGLARRSVHATAANAQSSRAHTVLTLRVRARVAPGGATRESALNLVDLAGSERAGAAANASSSPGQAAARLREGNHINRGLSALGNCVRALSERPAGSAAPGAGGNTPRGTRHVPYRDSMLTWLLKRSLDGHAKVLVVATLAPGTHTFAETLSTLRYADRMRKIETAAVVARPKGGVTASTASSAAAARERIVRRKAVSAPEARELQRKRALGALKQQQFNRQLSAGHERGAGAAARRPLIARREVKESSPVRRRQAFVSPYASPYASPAKPAALARKQVSRPSGRAQRVQVERLDDVAAVRLLPDVVVGQAVRTPRERLPAKRPAVAPVAKSPSGRGDKLQRLQLEILALARDLGGGAAAAKASPPRLAHAPSRQERPVLAF